MKKMYSFCQELCRAYVRLKENKNKILWMMSLEMAGRLIPSYTSSCFSLKDRNNVKTRIGTCQVFCTELSRCGDVSAEEEIGG